MCLRLKQVAGCFITLFFFACSYSYRLEISPEDSVILVDNQPRQIGRTYSNSQAQLNLFISREGYEPFQSIVTLKSVFSPETIIVQLKKKEYKISIKLINGEADFVLDNNQVGKLPYEGYLTYGEHKLILKSKGKEQVIDLFVNQNRDYVFRFQGKSLVVQPLGIFTCGKQPKQINFSPEGRFIFIPLLDGEGFDIFDLKEMKMHASIAVGKWAKSKGFPEGFFLPHTKTYLISQMSSNFIFEYAYTDSGELSFIRHFPSYGVFPKVIAFNKPLKLLAVSNWLSSDVAFIDYDTSKLVKQIKGLNTPRGVIFTEDGKYVFIASYDGGFVVKYETVSWKQVAIYSRPSAAMRHLILTSDESRLFVSDMTNNQVYELASEDLKLIAAYKVFSHPNTIDLSSDDRFLFVSCRGPNNPISYTLRSPEDGKIFIFDTSTRQEATIIEGGNQPTGLDVSPDNSLLVFSNFLDANFEIYDLKGLYEKKR